jgi:pectinesterase
MPKYISLLIVLLICHHASFAQEKNIPRDTSYNVEKVYRQIHKEFPMAVPAKDSVPTGVTADRNIVYTTLATTPFGKRDLHLDIFRPKKAGKYPALIMIHGGGWRSGTKEMQVPMAEMLAAKGFVTIPVEYQLSLEAKYPAAVYNIKSAIRWVHANAEKYGIDTSKIAISGCSAGGHLASLVGMTNAVQSFEGDQGNIGWSSAVKAIIDIDGVIDFMAPASLNLKRQPNSPDVEWLGGSFETKPAIWKEASPIFWATQSTTVPILFLNSGFSRFHAGQDELIGMMKEWEIYYEVHRFDIKMHPFWLFHPWVDQTVDYMSKFLRKLYGDK